MKDIILTITNLTEPPPLPTNDDWSVSTLHLLEHLAKREQITKR